MCIFFIVPSTTHLFDRVHNASSDTLRRQSVVKVDDPDMKVNTPPEHPKPRV